MRTRLLPGGTVAAIALATTLALGLAVPAGAGSSDEQSLLALANQARASAGRAPLSLDPGLSAIARQWAGQMAAAGTIWHNPDLAGQVTIDWRKLGENVGMGPDANTVHNALLNSPAHYANLVDADYDLVGMGVVRTSDGYVWVVQNFAQARSRPAPVHQEPLYEEPPAVVYEEPAWEPEPAPPQVEESAVDAEGLGRLALGLELVRALDRA